MTKPSDIPRCVECGGELPPGLPLGLCPQCALRAAAEIPYGEGPTEPAPAAVVTHQAGNVIGRYKLLQRIGEGGMGDVWMAEQFEPIRRKVALKVVKLGMDTNSVIGRFEAERQALALMDHPNIARVLDAGAAETGRPYFVMELVRGVKITDFCDQQKLTTRARLDLFMQVCHAVQHAHQKGIIHRDIKPSNILVTLHDGVPVPKVIDFGIAKATSDQRLTDKTLFTAFEQFMGTPAYMSPEQAEMSGLDIDTRSDIYSLGVLLYELLTGKTPFDAKQLLSIGLNEMRRTIREKEPARPSARLNILKESDQTEIAKHRRTEPNKLTTLLRGDLDWIVMKALEKDRTRRYESANGLAMDLQRHLYNQPVVACPPSNLYRLQKMLRRNRLAFAATTTVAMALLLGGIISTWQAVRATRAEHTQSRLRSDAENARTAAQTEARRAETASAQAEASLSTSDFLQGVHLASENRIDDAVAFLTRSFSNAASTEPALPFLAFLLTYRSWALPRLVLNHNHRVASAQFSSDGMRIVTASWDGTAWLWDAKTGQLLSKPMKHGSRVASAQFSPKGDRIVTASWDHTARVWDSQTGRPLTEPMQHGSNVVSAQFSADAKRIVTVSQDKMVRVWDADTGQPVTEPIKCSQPVTSAQFSPDGQRLVIAVWRDGFIVCDAESGKLMLEVSMQHKQLVFSAQFSRDGSRVITASSMNTARVWDAHTGQALTEPMLHKNAVYSAQFSPDGQQIATASQDGSARLWDTQSGKPQNEPMRHQGGVNSAQFSPDGKRIVTASTDHTARVWDTRTGQPVGEPIRHTRAVLSAQFSPDGKQIMTVSEDKVVHLWDTPAAKSLATTVEHTESVYSAQFSPDGKKIVTASRDNTARVWDAETGQALTEPMRHQAEVVSAEFRPDGNRIVTASRDHTARVWDVQTGRPQSDPLVHGGEVVSAEFSADGKRIVTTSSDNEARVWDAVTGWPLTEPIEHDSRVRSAGFNLSGTRIITVSKNNAVRVWDAQTGRPLGEPMNNDQSVKSARFSPDGDRIVTASGKTARVWDMQIGQPLSGPFEHDYDVNSVQFSPDGKRILTGTFSLEGALRVWDAQTGRRLVELIMPAVGVSSAQFSSDGRRIVATFNNTACVWDAQTGWPLTGPMEHHAWIRLAQFSPDGNRIVTTSANTARVWDIAPSAAKRPDWLLPLAEAVSGKVINEHGVPEASQLNRVKVLNHIRQRLNQEPGDDGWVVWGRWILADPATRTISPFSKVKGPAIDLQ